jgi:hypothetical protein
MYIKAGKYKTDKPNKQSYHIHFEGEPVPFPTVPVLGRETERLGYRFQLEKASDCLDEDTSVPFAPLDFDMYKNVFHNVCHHIDRTLYNNHGVKVYKDGNIGNTRFTNLYHFMYLTF